MVSMQENHHCGICFIDANWKEILYRSIMELMEFDKLEFSEVLIYE